MSREVVLKHPCIPCAVQQADGDKGQAMRKGGGAEGGRGRYKARRVKGAASIITCNLAASATHHLVSVVPRI